MVVILLQPLFAHHRLKPSTTLGVRLFDDVDEIAGALGVLDGLEGQPHLVRFGSAELNSFRLVPESIGHDRTCKHLTLCGLSSICALERTEKSITNRTDSQAGEARRPHPGPRGRQKLGRWQRVIPSFLTARWARVE